MTVVSGRRRRSRGRSQTLHFGFKDQDNVIDLNDKNAKWSILDECVGI